MDIGSNIRAIRKQKKITISQLCEGTGLQKTGIFRSQTRSSINPLLAGSPGF
jgi:transcriptional regulator with XRE-family HTH domain